MVKPKARKSHRERWEQGYAALSKFRAREGHCCPSRYHREGKYKLGRWVITQRYLRDDLSVERKRCLDRIGFVWNWRDYRWEQGFAALLKFKRREAHCHVPISHREEKYRLGYWVSVQRQKRNELSAARKRRLNKIGFVWREERWEQGYAALSKFRAREGHCCPSEYYRESKYNLGRWVITQRYLKDDLSIERKRCLDRIGFVWNWQDYRWEQGLNALLKFKRREGHCHVPIFHREGKHRLGYWVSVQRQKRNELSAARKLQLNKIGFVWRGVTGPRAPRASR
jgi:hypothetical protein